MGSEGPAKVKSQHNEAFRFINEGLKFDEQGQTQKALQLYHKGIRSLAVGLSVYCNGSGPEWDQARELQEKMTLAKKQLKERIETLSPRNAPSAPAELLLDRTPPQNGYNASNGVMEQHTVSADGETWEDVKELLVLENSVKMFFVSEQGNVTTLSQPQTLYVYQFVNYEPGSRDAPAFLQCGAWVFPMVPGRSPVLNTEPHTYMFPDITIDPSSPASSEPRPQRAFASVGLILNPNISSMSLDRFERVLKCYADFHHYTPPQDFDQERAAMDQGRATPSAPPPYGTAATEPGPSMALVVRPSTDMEPAESQGKSWGRKVSKGIEIGAELIAWGLTKGAEVGSSLMQKGSAKLRENLKPNQKPTEVNEKTQENIRHVKNVAGMACQVSGTVVSAVSAMTVELGRRIAPVIVDQGGKALPARMKKGADEVDGTSTMDEIVRVAVSGVRGAATVYMGLENSWKVLYKSLQYATVQTVDHKYGPAASEATNNAMGAMGYALQTYWNVDNLGIKALAKRTAKDTGKEMVKEAGKKYITDGQS